MSFKEIYTRIIPSATIATCFGIGNLPAWARYWTSFLSFLYTCVIILSTLSENNTSFFTQIEYGVLVKTGVKIAISAFFVFVFGSIAAKLYSIRTEKFDSIVINVFFGYLLTFAISLIGIEEIKINSIRFFNLACGKYIVCNDFFSNLFSSLLPCSITFVVYSMVDKIKIWPNNIFAANHVCGVTVGFFEIIISSIYSSIIILLISMIIFDLDIVVASNYLSQIVILTLSRITEITKSYYSSIMTIDIFTIMENIGLTGFLDSIGLLEKFGFVDNSI